MSNSLDIGNASGPFNEKAEFFSIVAGSVFSANYWHRL